MGPGREREDALTWDSRGASSFKCVFAASAGVGEVRRDRREGYKDTWNMGAPSVCTENEIAKIPAHTFLGLPNLEWLDLSKNKLDARGLHPGAFKVRSSPAACSPRGLASPRWPQASMAPLPPLPGGTRPRGSTEGPARRAWMMWGDTVHSWECGEQHKFVGSVREQHPWENLRGVLGTQIGLI